MFINAAQQELSRNGTDQDALIALVDDDPSVLEILSELLQEFGFSRIRCFHDAMQALQALESEPFDLVITDFRMPKVDGFELMRELHAKDPDLPVIMITGHADMERAVNAFKHGAFDFIVKPYQPFQVLTAIKNALASSEHKKLEQKYKNELEHKVRERTSELRSSLQQMARMNQEVIQRLSIAAEHRDDETGAHILRLALYVYRMAQLLGYDEYKAKQIGLATTMHDIGKIGIPDAILFKPSALTKEEFEIMKTHTTIGAKIFAGSTLEVLKLAAEIASSHHEKWDGSGYPHGLSGVDIPLPGRIVALADIYDALRSKRPYKLPFSHEKTCDIILKGDGRTAPDHFDPEILRLFSDHADEFDRIFNENMDIDHLTLNDIFKPEVDNPENEDPYFQSIDQTGFINVKGA